MLSRLADPGFLFIDLLHRDLKKAHKLELEKLENSYKDALKVEKASAQEKLGTVRPWEEAWERQSRPHGQGLAQP